MDATHTRSRYKVKTPIENLREVSKNIRKQLYRYVPEVKDHVPPKLHSTASLEEEVIYTQELIEFSHRYQDKNRQIQEAREKALDILKIEPTKLFFLSQIQKLKWVINLKLRRLPDIRHI